MEIPVMAGVCALGYLFKDSQKNAKTRTDNLNSENTYKKNTIQNVQNNPTDVYTNDRYGKTLSLEQQQVKDFYEKSENPTLTNKIPHGMNYMQTDEHITNHYNQPNLEKVHSNLAGIDIPKQNFGHNNMVPFFGSKMTQNTNIENFQNRTLEVETNGYFNWAPKKECKPLFEPTIGLTNITGTQLQSDRELERYIASNNRTMELPFEQIMVGPGLNKGYSAEPSGGFQQENTRDYVMPKSVDELRTSNNPKLTYAGRVVSGKSIEQRGMEGEVAKHRPDTFYIQEPSRYFTTIGAYTKETKRPTQLVKETNRQCTSNIEYFGDGAPAVAVEPEQRAAVKKSIKRNFLNDNPRNASATDQWVNLDKGDYGLHSLFLPSQEREVTELRTHVLNVSSVLKKVVTPIMDEINPGRKTNFIGNPNYVGYVQTNVSNLQVYDPNDVAKTTIKETTLSGDYVGIYDSYVPKPKAHDPNDVAKTTMKETTLNEDQIGNFQRNVLQHGKGYMTNKMHAPNTNKQFISDNDYTGIAESCEPTHMSYDDYYNARLNEVREGTLKLREPTQSNAPLMVGGDMINVETKKIESDQINARELSKTKVYNSIPQVNSCQVTNNKDQLNNDSLYERNNPSILSAFNQNPYSQSLNSVVNR